jgi:hypothetical protein
VVELTTASQTSDIGVHSLDGRLAFDDNTLLLGATNADFLYAAKATGDGYPEGALGALSVTIHGSTTGSVWFVWPDSWCMPTISETTFHPTSIAPGLLDSFPNDPPRMGVFNHLTIRNNDMEGLSSHLQEGKCFRSGRCSEAYDAYIHTLTVTVAVMCTALLLL